jgi:hypothetical protein
MGSVPVRRRKRAEVAGGPQVFRSPTAVAVWWVWLLFAAANLIDLAVQGRDHASLVAAAVLVMATGVAYVTAQRPKIVADNAGITVLNPVRDHHIGWAGVSKVDLADLLRVHCDTGQGRTKIIYCWAVHYSRRRKLAAEAKSRRAAARPNSGRSSLGMGGFGGLGTFGGGSSGYGGGTGYASPPSTAEAEAERIARVLGEYATAARAEAVWADGTVQIAGPKQTEEPDEPDEAGGPNEAKAPELAARAKAPESPATAEHLPVAGWLDPLTSPWSRQAILALLIPALILLVVCLVLRPGAAAQVHGRRLTSRGGGPRPRATAHLQGRRLTSRAARTRTARCCRRPSWRTAARVAPPRSRQARPPSLPRRPRSRRPAPTAARPRRS